MKSDRKEINAVVLDYLPRGHLSGKRPQYKNEPLIQAVGTDQFKLLELTPKPNTDLSLHDRVYIGDQERDKIERVKRRIGYQELTATAKLELPFAVTDIVNENESRFVELFNTAVPISQKLHMLHLIPGIGKKILWEILEERQKKPFENFKDISSRIKSLPHPEKMVVNRVIEELEDPEVKYRLFTSR